MSGRAQRAACSPARPGRFGLVLGGGGVLGAAWMTGALAAVTVLTPGPEDLAVMGGNLMDPRRREEVFETSLATSAAAMAQHPSGSLGAA